MLLNDHMLYLLIDRVFRLSFRLAEDPGNVETAHWPIETV